MSAVLFVIVGAVAGVGLLWLIFWGLMHIAMRNLSDDLAEAIYRQLLEDLNDEE